jgi:hypothetical protein
MGQVSGGINIISFVIRKLKVRRETSFGLCETFDSVVVKNPDKSSFRENMTINTFATPLCALRLKTSIACSAVKKGLNNSCLQNRLFQPPFLSPRTVKL